MRSFEIPLDTDFFARIQEMANIGIWRLDLQDNSVYWSDQVYIIHEVPVGSPIDLSKGIYFYHKDYRETISLAIQDCIEKHIPYDLELKLVTAKRRTIWVRAIGFPMVENGETVALYGLFQNIHEQKTNQEKIENLVNNLEQKVNQRTRELQGAINELESFSYSISHDLRAPLRALEGFSKLVYDKYKDVLDDSGKRWLNYINENARKMDGLTSDILHFSRVSRGELSKSTFDTRLLVEEVFREQSSDLANCRIELNLHNELPKTYGDRSTLRQVWANLISNAIKFSSKSDTIQIEVGCEQNGNGKIFYVKDNGVGFDEKYKGKLFNVFSRLHKDSEFEGTGIGLAIVKRIVSKHSGKVWVNSAPGKGATFYFQLPDNNN